MIQQRRNPVDTHNQFVTDLLTNTQPWMAHASCRDLTPLEADRMFFGQGRRPNAAAQMCGTCPVQTNCLQFGLDEEFGMWGGATPRQRGVGAATP